MQRVYQNLFMNHSTVTVNYFYYNPVYLITRCMECLQNETAVVVTISRAGYHKHLGWANLSATPDNIK